MIEVHFVEADGRRHRVLARSNITLMELAVRQGMPGILAECGGSCACATCHVVIDPDWTAAIGGPNDMEDMMLDLVDRQPGSRLSCQVKLRDAMTGMVVHLPNPNG
ncbi:2Fe-2S iron-sulfur cluster-binding protein [Sandarakinorhabdus sp. DWP1-3-1]|uniref:2Fe-2S iron-sulfur cluster-binding protein n=1 Tax=Sandarakinorhabdus sp. DWP1-3-1 TaxID=2804627 RepID=UPI003CFA1AAD